MEKEQACPFPFHDFQGVEEGRQSASMELMHAFQRFRRVNISLVMEVAPGEFYVLQIIEKYRREYPDRKGIYVSKIAGKAMMAPSQVSRMLRGLEERDLIGKSVDAKDKRNTYVYLTKEGEETYLRAKNRVENYTRRVRDSMGEARVKELVNLCNQMAQIMEDELELLKEDRQSQCMNRKGDGKHGKNS